jgi:type IX secretion system substrate protein
MAKNLLSRMRYLVLAFIGLAVMSNSLMAEELGTPMITWGQLTQNNTIMLHGFAGNKSEDMQGFRLLHAEGVVKDHSKMEVLDGYFYINRTKFDVADSLELEFITKEVLKNGKHSFAIYAVNENEKSEPSNIYWLEFNNNTDYFKITSQPNYFAILGEDYVYEPVVETNIEGKITYELKGTSSCDDFGNISFNEEVGTIIITPKEICKYDLTLTAKIEGESKAYDVKHFYVQTRHCKEEHYISGMIRYDDGEPVGFTMVEIYKNVDGVYEQVMTARVVDGQYQASVDKGEYKMYVYGNDFFGEWYEDAETIHDAKVFNINCEDIDNIDWKVKRLPKEEFFKVSGKVTSIETGDPLPGAIIKFFPIKSKSDTYGGGKPKWSFTDDKGEYSTELSNRYYYKSYCLIADTTDNSVKSILMFFNQTFNPDEAETLDFIADETGIDFMMPDYSFYENSVTATVVDEDLNPVSMAGVVAFKIGPDPMDMKNPLFHASTGTSPQGEFKFKGLFPGEYVFMVRTADRTLIPGFYLANDFAIRDWQKATVVEVGETGEFGGFQVKLKKAKKDGGICHLTGKVRKNAGGVIKVGGGNVLGSETVNGAIVYMVNSSGEVDGFAMSEFKGDFEISGLEKETYTLEAIKFGFETSIAIIDFDEDNTYQEHDLDLIPVVTSVEDDYDFELVNAVVYPNPANNDFNVTFKSEAGTASMELLTVSGLQVASKQFTTVAGMNTVPMLTNDINSGVYYLRVKIGNRTIVKNITIIK